MSEEILQNGLFYCNHLGDSKNDEQDIMNFSVKNIYGGGLVDYIRYSAFADEKTGGMRTYIVRDISSSELAGYFSLKAGLISLNEQETVERVAFDILPGVELANFALNDRYIRKYPDLRNKGVGFIIFSDFIRPIVVKAAQHIGVKILYIFALPNEKLIRLYSDRYGFARLDAASELKLHSRLKPSYDEDCIFMYQNIRDPN